MEIILLEKYKKLGNIGDIVNVKDGYARNYLVPQHKALRATKNNKEIFETKKAAIKKEFERNIKNATLIKDKIDGKHILIIKQSSEDERLYGSVNSSDIVKGVKEQLSQEIKRSNIDMTVQIKYIGTHNIAINLLADVIAIVTLVVARSKEEGGKLLAELKGEKKEKSKTTATKKSKEKKDTQEKKKDTTKSKKSKADDKLLEAEISEAKEASEQDSSKKKGK